MKKIRAYIFIIVVFSGVVFADPRLWEVSNTTELQQAITQLQATGWGTIHLLPGIYVMTDTVDFSVPHVNLIGSGFNTVWQKSGNGNAIEFLTGATRAIVRNLKIAADSNATSGSGIVVKTVCSFVNYCQIENFPENGILLLGENLSSNTVSNCHLQGNTEYQIYSKGNNDFYFVRNKVFSGGDSNGALLESSSAGTYAENFHHGNKVGLIMKNCCYNRIVNNSFDQISLSAITIGQPEGVDWNNYHIILGNTICDSSMSDPGTFPAITAYYATNVTFLNNYIYSDDWNHNFSKQSDGIELGTGCDYWIVKKNILWGYKLDAIDYNQSLNHIVKDNITATSGPFDADINKDGCIDFEDLSIIVENWLFGF